LLLDAEAESCEKLAMDLVVNKEGGGDGGDLVDSPMTEPAASPHLNNDHNDDDDDDDEEPTLTVAVADEDDDKKTLCALPVEIFEPKSVIDDQDKRSHVEEPEAVNDEPITEDRSLSEAKSAMSNEPPPSSTQR